VVFRALRAVGKIGGQDPSQRDREDRTIADHRSKHTRIIQKVGLRAMWMRSYTGALFKGLRQEVVSSKESKSRATAIGREAPSNRTNGPCVILTGVGQAERDSGWAGEKEQTVR